MKKSEIIRVHSDFKKLLDELNNQLKFNNGIRTSHVDTSFFLAKRIESNRKIFNDLKPPEFSSFPFSTRKKYRKI